MEWAGGTGIFSRVGYRSLPALSTEYEPQSLTIKANSGDHWIEWVGVTGIFSRVGSDPYLIWQGGQ